MTRFGSASGRGRRGDGSSTVQGGLFRRDATIGGFYLASHDCKYYLRRIPFVTGLLDGEAMMVLWPLISTMSSVSSALWRPQRYLFHYRCYSRLLRAQRTNEEGVVKLQRIQDLSCYHVLLVKFRRRRCSHICDNWTEEVAPQRTMVSSWLPWYLRIVFWALRVTISGSFPLYHPRTLLARSSRRHADRSSCRSLQPECHWYRQAWNTVLQRAAVSAAAASSESSKSELDGDNATTATPLVFEMTASTPSTRNDRDRAPDNGSSSSSSSSSIRSTPMPGAVVIHHTALQTRNITTAILFYTTLLDFQVSCRFRAGPARAAWLSTSGSSSTSSSSSRLELIEVPPYLWPPLPPTSGHGPLPPPPPRALDILTKYPTWLGYHHLALDVTSSVQAFKEKQTTSSNNDTLALWNGSDTAIQSRRRRPHLWLQAWLELELQEKSRALYNKTIRVAVSPRQQIMGSNVYELAWIYDADGCLVELLYQAGPAWSQTVSSGWEPWNGTNFQQ
jgi:hypothetical protein